MDGTCPATDACSSPARTSGLALDLHPSGVVARIDRQSQPNVRIGRIRPVILQCIRPQLVQKADPTAFMTSHVDDNASIFPCDGVQRHLQLGPLFHRTGNTCSTNSL